MKYRSWKYEDLQKIVELDADCFSDAWTFRMFADSFSSEYFFGVVAEDDNGELAGYAFETVLFETAETERIAVDDNFRRRGIAKEMLTLLEKEAKQRNAERMILEVRVSNSPAMSLYLLSGYKGMHARTRYYPNGEDALVMQKKL